MLHPRTIVLALVAFVPIAADVSTFISVGLTSVEIATDGLGNLYLPGSSPEGGAYATSGVIRDGESFLAASPEGAETYHTRLDAGRLACVQDSANLNCLAVVAPGPLITLFGDGLGPAPGVGSEAAEGQLPAAVAGLQVSFDGLPAPILYAGPSQINLRLLNPYLSGRSYFPVTVDGTPLAEDPLLVWVARPR